MSPLFKRKLTTTTFFTVNCRFFPLCCSIVALRFKSNQLYGNYPKRTKQDI